MSTQNLIMSFLGATLAGILISVQMAIESNLKQTVLHRYEPIAVLAFGSGLLLVLLFCWGTGSSPIPTSAELSQMSPQHFIGGVCRLIYLGLVIYSCKQTNIGLTTVFLVAAQISTAAYIDTHGLFGASAVEWSSTKKLGAALLVLGVFFIVPNSGGKVHRIQNKDTESSLMQTNIKN